MVFSGHRPRLATSFPTPRTMTMSDSSPAASSSSWHCTDADEHGFVPFEYVQRRIISGGREQFLRDFPAPALLVVFRGSAPEQEHFDPNQSGVQLLTVSVKSAGVLRYLGRVAFVCKKPGNPFAHLVSVGRSASNDVTIAVESVSKVHGYLVLEDGRWCYTDHGSTNGTKINGKKVDKGQKVTLDDGDVIQLGLEVMLEFLTPDALYRRATKTAG
jgi:hypothetical protein